MNWLFLIIAGIFEAVFAACLGKARSATGNAVFWWYTGFVIALIISMSLLVKAVQTLPVGTAYAIWTGIGCAGSVLVGIIIFKDAITFWRLFFLTTLIASIIGLKIFSN